MQRWVPALLSPAVDHAHSDGDDLSIDGVDGLADGDLSRFGISDVMPMSKQQAADAEAIKWAGIWQPGIRSNGPSRPADLWPTLPEVALAKLRGACNTFAVNVGLVQASSP